MLFADDALSPTRRREYSFIRRRVRCITAREINRVVDTAAIRQLSDNSRRCNDDAIDVARETQGNSAFRSEPYFEYEWTISRYSRLFMLERNTDNDIDIGYKPRVSSYVRMSTEKMLLRFKIVQGRNE